MFQIILIAIYVTGSLACLMIFLETFYYRGSRRALERLNHSFQEKTPSAEEIPDTLDELEISPHGMVAERVFTLKAIIKSRCPFDRADLDESSEKQRGKFWLFASSIQRLAISLLLIMGIAGTLTAFHTIFPDGDAIKAGNAAETLAVIQSSNKETIANLKQAFIPSIHAILSIIICLTLRSLCLGIVKEDFFAFLDLVSKKYLIPIYTAAFNYDVAKAQSPGKLLQAAKQFAGSVDMFTHHLATATRVGASLPKAWENATTTFEAKMAEGAQKIDASAEAFVRKVSASSHTVSNNLEQGAQKAQDYLNNSAQSVGKVWEDSANLTKTALEEGASSLSHSGKEFKEAMTGTSATFTESTNQFVQATSADSPMMQTFDSLYHLLQPAQEQQKKLAEAIEAMVKQATDQNIRMVKAEAEFLELTGAIKDYLQKSDAAAQKLQQQREDAANTLQEQRQTEIEQVFKKQLEAFAGLQQKTGKLILHLQKDMTEQRKGFAQNLQQSMQYMHSCVQTLHKLTGILDERSQKMAAKRAKKSGRSFF